MRPIAPFAPALSDRSVPPRRRPIRRRSWTRRGTIVAAALLAGPAAAGADALGDRTLLRAIGELERGQWCAAAESLRTVIDPRRPGELWAEARFFAAEAELGCGDSDAALAQLTGLEDQLPEVTDLVLAFRARAQRQTLAWSEALATWRRLLQEHPESPFVSEALYGVADALFAANSAAAARDAYQTALARGPRAPGADTARLNLALLDERLRRWAEATAGYSEIFYYRPESPDADLAGERLRRLVEAGRAVPASFTVRLERIDRLIARRRIDAAAAELATLAPEATSRSQTTGLLLRRAQLAFAARDYPTAQRLFGEAAAASSSWRRRSAELMIARTLSAMNDNDGAIAAYRALADRYPTLRDGREAMFKAAWLAYNSRDHAQALKLFGEFLARYPSDGAVDEALWYVAWNAYRLGDLPTAVAHLVRLESERPRSELVQRARYWQGRWQEQLGEGSAARRAFEQAIASRPHSYYGALARERLQALNQETAPEAAGGRVLYFAALDEPAEVTGAVLEPGPAELPEDGGLAPLSGTRLPWGGAVLDWSGAAGRRAHRLLRLGQRRLAGELVRALPAVPGLDAETVAYGRARVLFGLGDYHAAYRLASAQFRNLATGSIDAAVRPQAALVYPPAYRHLVQRAASEFTISPLLILAVMRQESAFSPTAESWAAARGLMQIIPRTGERIAAALAVEDYALADLDQPETNVRFGAWYLGELLRMFHGHPVPAIAAYNAGPRAVTRWLGALPGAPTDEFVEEIPYRETRNYVRRVLDNLAAYQHLYAGGPLQVPAQLPTDHVETVDF